MLNKTENIKPWEIRKGDVIYGNIPPNKDLQPIGESAGNAHPLSNANGLWRIMVNRGTIKYIDVPADRKICVSRKPQKLKVG